MNKRLVSFLLFYSGKGLYLVITNIIHPTVNMSSSSVESRVSREVGGTELSMCRALPGGTGITVLALLLSKPPDLQTLETALHKLQNAHPILRSEIHSNPTTRSFSFVTPTASTLRIKSIDLQSTLKIFGEQKGAAEWSSLSLPAFQTLLEHELNLNPAETWPSNVLEAKVYELGGGRWMIALKTQLAACDRAAGEVVLNQLVNLIGSHNGGKPIMETDGEVNLGIEEYGFSGKAKKSLWARGANMLGYSLKAFRHANLDLLDTRSPRCTKLLRLRLDPHLTTKLLQGCRLREMKLCGALIASALIAARRSSKRALQGKSYKYGFATLVDCRSHLEPPLRSHDVGFYHSAILTTQEMNGREEFWDVAEKAYKSIKDAKSSNKQLVDMADLNFLMCRAIENPSLTPSSALRSVFVTVFEDHVVQNLVNDKAYQEAGVEDYLVCSSVHGVGPSLSLFNSVRDGALDCWCAYPWPLHSRDQMQALLHQMELVLVDATRSIIIDPRP